MKKFWKDFKAFISKGNILELAIAVIIGAAFGKIVTSLVNDMIMPLISLIFTACGLKGFEAWKWEILDKNGAVAATLNYGNFIRTIIDFFLIALCIFIAFRLIKRATGKVKGAAQKLSDKKKAGAEGPTAEAAETAVAVEQPAEPTTNELLVQIRDLLAAQKINANPVNDTDKQK